MAPPRPSGARLPRRFVLVGLCFVATFICFMDRVNLSVAVIPMAEHFGWDQTTRGVILSAFFFGYVSTQILGGWLADGFGGKAVLGGGVAAWSLFTLLTPLAATSFPLLFAARVGLGLGEGVTIGAVASLVSRWMPVGERSRAMALAQSGLTFGTVCGLLLTPWITVRWGWPIVFYAFGLVGFVWLVPWIRLVSDTPESHPTIDAEELALIRANRSDVSHSATVPWRTLLGAPAVWAVVLNNFAASWGFYVLLSWLPTYFNQALHVRLADLGAYTFLPWLIMFGGMNGSAWIADALIHRGFTVTFARKLMESIAFVGAAFFLLQIARTSSPLLAMAFVCAAMGFQSFVAAGYLVTPLDIAPRFAGVVHGISNTLGTLPGIIGVTLTGWILDAGGSWTTVFAITAALYAAATAVWLLFVTGERIVD